MSEVSAPEKKPKKYGKYEDYEIESAVRTIVEAEEIKNDAEKMKYVKPLLSDKMQAMKKTISSIGELREHAEKMNDSDYEKEDA
jgi:hypothetical protein